MESKFISELSSPIATGAGGVSFEINAQTLFAILMLSHGRVPGFPCHEIIELRQQTRVEGNNIDDFLLVLKHSNTEVISNVYCKLRGVLISGITPLLERSFRLLILTHAIKNLTANVIFYR